jgi:flagellar protein FliJ
VRFQYSFQQIVDLKNNERTQAEWILSEAIGRLRTEESSLDSLHSQKNELREQIVAATKNKTTISEMLLIQQYMEHLEVQIEKKHEDVEVAQYAVVKKQEHLSEKVLDEKLWNKAREKAYTQFKELAGKKEQEALDEMATNRYKRFS